MKVETCTDKDFTKAFIEDYIKYLLSNTDKQDYYLNVITGSGRSQKRLFEIGYNHREQSVFFRDVQRLKIVDKRAILDLKKRSVRVEFIDNINQYRKSILKINTIEYYKCCDTKEQIESNLTEFKKHNDYKGVFRFQVKASDNTDITHEVLVERQNKFLYLLMRNSKNDFLYETRLHEQDFNTRVIASFLWESRSPIQLGNIEIEEYER